MSEVQTRVLQLIKTPRLLMLRLSFGCIFAGKKKKAKQSNPAVVEISQSLYSCRSSKVTVASLPVVETHGCVHA